MYGDSQGIIGRHISLLGIWCGRIAPGWLLYTVHRYLGYSSGVMLGVLLVYISFQIIF